ncbi:hypothetical protein ACFL6I_11980 [candidate division KSB1 bacterium]
MKFILIHDLITDVTRLDSRSFNTLPENSDVLINNDPKGRDGNDRMGHDCENVQPH